MRRPVRWPSTATPSVETSIPTQPTATIASAPARMRPAGPALRASADPTSHTAATVSATTAMRRRRTRANHGAPCGCGRRLPAQGTAAALVHWRAMSSHLLAQILSGLQVLLGVGLVVLVLMHSGKDAGLSGMLNPGGSSYGGTAVMERNLTRLTVFVAIIFTVNVIALGFLL